MQNTTKPYGTTLFVAIDLGWTTWKLTFSDGKRPRPRVRTLPAREIGRLLEEMAAARQRFGLPEQAPVCSCYEAGRDGFWLHRMLEHHGVRSVVVDPGSIEVSQKARRAKTDRLDAEKLLRLLVEHWNGGTRWSVVRVPDEHQEDERRLHRELRRLNQERTSLRNRIHSLLATEGIECRKLSRVDELSTQLRRWDCTPLSPRMQQELRRLHERLQLVSSHIRDVRKEQKRLFDEGKSKQLDQVRQLTMLKGIGLRGAWVLVMEFFGWRQFRNRKEVGALAGLTGTPHCSDGTRREQGISKAGNAYIRGLMIELAWQWLRYQPDSALSRWFEERWARGSGRSRRVGIVALSRKLLIALWRFVDQGLVPEGAVFKPAGAVIR